MNLEEFKSQYLQDFQPNYVQEEEQYMPNSDSKISSDDLDDNKDINQKDSSEQKNGRRK